MPDPDGTGTESVTVTILTRDRLPQLQACIESVRPQLLPGDEIVVLDTGSRDGTRDWLRAQDVPLRYEVAEITEGGFAAARNRAVRETTGDIVAFIDDDCIAPPDWLARIRAAMRDCDAVGGPVVPGLDYRYPWWWSPEVSWAVGMSGPGLAEGRPDSYPATANMAVRRRLLVDHPFQVTEHGFAGRKTYLSGREDAQWWLDARIRGERLAVDPAMCMRHCVPPDRLRLRYVLHRAMADGAAAVERRPLPDFARVATTEMWIGALRLACAPWRAVTDPRVAVCAAVWTLRQFSVMRHARRIGLRLPATQVARAAVQAARIVAGDAILASRRLQHRQGQPPANPARVAVIAPTYLGDTVLIEPLVRLLGRSLPDADIVLLTTFPSMLRFDEPNVRIVPFAAGQDHSDLRADFHIVPYYHFGCRAQWMRTFARRAATFESDVGFRRRWDSYLASVVVAKDFDCHELLNLQRLFAQWPLAGELERPRLHVSDDDRDALHAAAPALARGAWFTVQLGAGLPTKEWPRERWFELAREFGARHALQPVFIGDAGQLQAARELAGPAELDDAEILCGQPLGVQLAAIESARIALGACSGPKHAAMALGTPTFTLYGPSGPTRWGAMFDVHLHGHICSPVRDLTPLEACGLPPNHSMLAMDVDTVQAALERHWTHLQAAHAPD